MFIEKQVTINTLIVFIKILAEVLNNHVIFIKFM